MSFRAVLRLTTALLLVATMSVMGLMLYGRATSRATSYMSMTDRVELNTIAFNIGSAYANAVKACGYIRGSERMLDNIRSCASDDKAASERAKAFTSITDAFTLILDGDDSIYGIALCTPDKKYVTGSYETFRSNTVDLPPPEDEEIAFHYPNGYNFYCAGDKAANEPMDAPHFTFSLSGMPGAYVYVIMRDSFLMNAAGERAALVVTDGENVIYRPDAPAIAAIDDGRFLDLAASGGEAIIGDTRLYAAPIAQTGWTAIYLRDQSEYSNEYSFILMMTLMAMAAAAIMAIALSRILAKSVLSPFTGLLGALSRYSAGEDDRLTPDKRRSMGLREKLFLFLSLTVLAPAVLFTALETLVEVDVDERHSRDAYAAVTENVSSTFAEYFAGKRGALARIAYDAEIVDCISGDKGIEELFAMVRENTAFNLDHTWVNISAADGRTLYSNSLARDEMSASRKYPLNEWRAEVSDTGETRLMISAFIGREAPSFYGLNGYVTLIEDYSLIDYMLLTLTSYSADVCLTDVSGARLDGGALALPEALPPSDETLELGNGVEVFAARRIERTPWYAVSRYERRGYGEALKELSADMASALAICLLSVTLAAYVISYALLAPLSAVGRALAKLVPGDARERLSRSSIDEVNDIIEQFNQMADRIDSLIDDLLVSNGAKLRLENEKKNAEIIALQMQINPHFLSNTIDTIVSITGEGRVSEARDMLYAMNNLFRLCISRPTVVISVSEEMQYARSYVHIMSVRYPNVSFAWRADESLMDCETVKLVLQPVIENAIYHGVRRTDAGGEITITLSEEEGLVCFGVRDNGVGLESAKLQRLREDLADARLGSLIGLMNVQARVRLQYGAEYGLRVESQLGQGCFVRILLPKRQATAGK